MTENEKIMLLEKVAKESLTRRIEKLNERQAKYALQILMTGMLKTVSAAVSCAEAR